VRITIRAERIFQLVFAGSDKCQPKYVKGLTRELGVAHQVRFLGLVDSEELVKLYQHAHALLYLGFFSPEISRH
jgi:glycosyltransferase involved in cell wall biosynthesis